MEYFPPFMDGHLGLFPAPQASETFAKEVTKTVLGPQNYSRQTAVSAFAAAPKACAQCGTTRTPQWREGPEGPKTLCNACGVKRVRQMRTSSEAGRRKASKSPAVLQQEAADAPALAADYHGPREALQRRPSRKLSLRGRGSDDAGPVEWQAEAEEEDQSCPSSQETVSADTGGQNSDSAEEVAWVPERHAHPCHLPPSPMAKAVGQECAAAVNLLSMSVHENNLKQAARVQRSPGNAHKEALQINAASYAQMANSALKWSSHMPSHAKAQDLIQDALGLLPADKHAEILAAKTELDSTSREAAAADAAVAAVAKILAMKQAAAIKARASAAKAAKRIHTFMQSLDGEYGWSQQALKRQRSFQ